MPLLKQPGVLDRDDRLVGEGFDQLDLLLCERPYSNAMKDQQTYWNPLAQKWHAEDCAIIAESRGFKEGVFRVSKNIRDLNGFSLLQDAADHTAATGCKRLWLQVFFVFKRVPIACG